MRVLGDSTATEEDVNVILKLLRDVGGIDYVSKRARVLVEDAIEILKALPESSYKDLLYQWAEFMVSREF